MSKSTDQWFTPPRECEMVRLALGGTIDLDPCGHPRAHVRALRIVFEQEDGFRLSWRRYSRIFCNPPYSDPAPWAARCRRHAMIDGGDAILLCKADTSTTWWHESIWSADAAVCFPFSRMKFSPGPGLSAKTGPKFAIAIVHYGATFRQRFIDVFRSYGKVVQLP